MTLSLFFSLTIFLKVFLYVYHLFVRDREERLAALTAAQQEAMEELQKKIQLKVKEKNIYIKIKKILQLKNTLSNTKIL